MTVIDIHTHMLTREWLDLLAERSGTYTLAPVPGGDTAIHRGGAPFMTLTPAMFDYDLRLEAMDRAGVDISIVSLTCPNVYWGDRETSAKAARLVNDDMAAARDRHPDRIRFLASLPWQHPEDAVAELDRACSAGAVGVMVLANIDGLALTDPLFDPVWTAIDERALPVLLHPTTPPGIEQMAMNQYHLPWSIGFTFDTTLALARMLMDGYFDRYRHLRIIGGHAGGYLPFVLSRLDAGHRYFPAVRERIDQPPSSFANQLFVDAIVYDPRTLRFVVDTFGPDNVLYGSDFPHKNGHMEEILGIVDTLGDSTARKIRHQNAERIFNL